MDLTIARLEQDGLHDRTEIVLGTVDALPQDAVYDAATLIGVLHHLPGDAEKRAILQAIAGRLKPGAPLMLAGNHYAYASQPLLLAAWGTDDPLVDLSGDGIINGGDLTLLLAAWGLCP